MSFTTKFVEGYMQEVMIFIGAYLIDSFSDNNYYDACSHAINNNKNDKILVVAAAIFAVKMIVTIK